MTYAATRCDRRETLFIASPHLAEEEGRLLQAARPLEIRRRTRSAPASALLASHIALILAGTGFAADAAAQTGQGGAAAATQDASADQTPVDKTTKLEKVTVTGSNIRSVDVEAAQPVLTITSEQIDRQGFATVGQLLQNVTSMTPPDLSRSAPGDLGPNQGGAFIDLRGLGAPRTLVLVDGQRIGAAHGGYTNVNAIPTSIIERIDVLASGASAVYGSDAIAGVINIITKKHFEGMQFDLYGGAYLPHQDGSQGQYSFTYGKQTERWGVVFSASYQNQNPVWTGDRDFSRYPWTDQHPYYGLTVYGPRGYIRSGPNGRQILNDGGDSTNPADYHTYHGAIYGSDGDVHSLADARDANINTFAGHNQMLLTADKTKNLYFDAHYDLTSNVRLKANLGYNLDDEFAQSGAPVIYSGSAAGRTILLSSQSYYNPYNGIADIQTGRSLIDTNVRYRSWNNPKNYRYSFGLEGNFSWGDRDFTWEAYTYDSKVIGKNTRAGYFDVPKLMLAMGPSFKDTDGTIKCGTPGNVVAGCVPFNALAGPGGISQAMLDYLSINSVERYGSEDRAYAANLSGNLWTLPAGNLTFAVGVERRQESGNDRPDAYAYAGNSTDGGVGPNQGQYSLNEGYLELNAPLLKDLPFAKSLSLDAARRFSDYSNFGTTRNNSFKITWQPVDDLMFRGSYSTGFRAPTVNDLYQGQYPAGTFLDPCDSVFGGPTYGSSPLLAQRCLNGYGGQPGVPANFHQLDTSGLPITGPGGSGVLPTTNFTGGNPNLRPETSYSSGIGFVYSPSWLPGFNASVDWWHYNVQNLISGLGNNQLLANCYIYSIVWACGQFKRQADTGQIYDLLNLETNVGYQKQSGYDFAFSYKLPETALGNFTLGLNATYYSKLEYLSTPGSNVVEGVGNTFSGYVVWRMRATPSVAWEHGDWGGTLSARYYSPYKTGCAFPPPGERTAFPCTDPDYYQPQVGVVSQTRVPSVTFTDVQVHWKAPWNATISLGANNVFNRVGPYIYGAYVSGSDTPYNYNASYDIGRFVYVRYQQKF